MFKFILGFITFMLLFSCSKNPTEPKYIEPKAEIVGWWPENIGSIRSDDKYRLFLEIRVIQFDNYQDLLVSAYIYFDGKHTDSGKAELLETITKKLDASLFESTGIYITNIQSDRLYTFEEIYQVFPAIDVD